mgnify:CR=1 FL=1
MAEVKTVADEGAAFVHLIVGQYQGYINQEPGLLSLLYDIDLLPEQLLHVLRVNPDAAPVNASRMAAVCDLWSGAIRRPQGAA